MSGSGAIWATTLVWALVGAGLAAALIWRVKPERFRQTAWPFVIASATFWGIFAVSLHLIFWDTYYSYFAPAYTRWLAPVVAVIYAPIGLGLWWLAKKLPGHPALTFCLLGGLESIPEHLLGIYQFKILEIPGFGFENVTPLSILVFAVFEYIVYWGIVAALGALIGWGWETRKARRQQPAGS